MLIVPGRRCSDGFQVIKSILARGTVEHVKMQRVAGLMADSVSGNCKGAAP